MANTEMADRIKKAIRASGEKQRQVAAALGIKETTFSSYVTGAAEPSAEVLGLIAKACNVTTDWLITGQEQPAATIPVVAEEITPFGGLTRDERYLLRTFRQLHPAEQDKLIELAELYADVKELRKKDGGGSDCAESKSARN